MIISIHYTNIHLLVLRITSKQERLYSKPTSHSNSHKRNKKIISITDQHYALIITPLFNTQAPTCFGIHVPSSGSFLCPYELLEGRIGYVVVMYCEYSILPLRRKAPEKSDGFGRV
jgi:hypothetical protein